MKLHTEYITKNNRFWEEVNRLAKEAFPPEEYLAPQTLVDMAKTDHLDFLALSERDVFVGFMVVKTYKNLAYLFFLAINPSCRSKGYGSRAIETLKAEYPGKSKSLILKCLMIMRRIMNKERSDAISTCETVIRKQDYFYHIWE